jgi:hypothetical protein
MDSKDNYKLHNFEYNEDNEDFSLTQPWTEDEQYGFIAGMLSYGADWPKI